MPTIYDLFGYPVGDRSETVENTRKASRCPFMGAVCDGVETDTKRKSG